MVDYRKPQRERELRERYANSGNPLSQPIHPSPMPPFGTAIPDTNVFKPGPGTPPPVTRVVGICSVDGIVYVATDRSIYKIDPFDRLVELEFVPWQARE